MRVATYSRVSTTHHEQNVEVQTHELRRYCATRSWSVTREIVDEGYSGGTDDRPGLKTLLSLVTTRQVDCVVVVKLDRLFRSLKHLVGVLDAWRELGVVFVATRDNVDYTTPAGRFFIQVLGSLAEFEKSLLRERTIMGLQHAKATGSTLGRPQLHNPDEILRLRLSGLTYRQIQQRTNAPMGSIARAIKAGARKTPPPNKKAGG